MAAKRRADAEKGVQGRQTCKKTTQELVEGVVASNNKRICRIESQKAAMTVDDSEASKKRKKPCDEEAIKQVDATGSTHEAKKRRISHNDSTGSQVAADEDTTATHRSIDEGNSNAMTAARDTVFDLPELFDAILSFLPGRNILFHAQRVCKRWKSTIDESPTIQKKLWLKCDAAQAVAPLSYSADRPVLETIHRNVSFATSEKDLPVYPGNVLCNFLCQFRSAPRYPQRPTHGAWTTEQPGRCADPQPKLICKRMLVNAARWKEARAVVQPSRLKMYLIEPRITVAQVDVISGNASYGSFPGHRTCHSVSVRDTNGLTFGTVLKEAEKVRRSASTYTQGYSDARVAIWFIRDIEVVDAEAAS